MWITNILPVFCAADLLTCCIMYAAYVFICKQKIPINKNKIKLLTITNFYLPCFIFSDISLLTVKVIAPWESVRVINTFSILLQLLALWMHLWRFYNQSHNGKLAHRCLTRCTLLSLIMNSIKTN